MSALELVARCGYSMEEATEIVAKRQALEDEIDAQAEAEGFATRRAYKNPSAKMRG